MSDKMNPISFEGLLKKLLREYKDNKSFLSVPIKRNTDRNYISPIGPAAGPHTQLAGNIVSAYGAGASHFELKTVQIMEGEELGIVKPCIYSSHEVYNTEWSTELTVKQATEEYIKAYLLLKVLIKEFGLGNTEGFHFTMSVGYTLAGIQSEKIDQFIASMKNASEVEEWKKDISYLLGHMNLFDHVTEEYIQSISPVISNTITLSTMHGCKREEIEEIAKYLIEEKDLHTYVKMNPTLLGKEKIRVILDQMGYGHVTFEEKIFEIDLNFSEAVRMIRSLQEAAESKEKEFGVKLTNTFPVKINHQELAGETMYLSGPALYPISIAVAAKLAEEFEGKLRISYSGGADCFNITDILKTGIYPVTISSILLKPGGYKNLTRMNQRIELMDSTTALTVQGRNSRKYIEVDTLNTLAKKAVFQKEYIKKEEKKYIASQEYSILCSKCNNCIDVCPNRANKKIIIEENAYIIHYDNLCNECGNCSFHCIAGHEPYLEKFTVFDRVHAMQCSENQGVYADEKSTLYRIKDKEMLEKMKKLEGYYEF